jgi:multicomponent Na+:H+ antiporter subunit E
VKYAISLGFVLFGVWLLWSGIYKPLLLILGGLSCILVLMVVRRMNVVDAETAPLELSFRALLYLPWIAWEIVKANVDVARRILSPGLPVAPRLIRVRASQTSDLGRTIYANSITLTPGTVTVDVEGDEFTVHALTREAAEGVQEGAMDRRVRRLEPR